MNIRNMMTLAAGTAVATLAAAGAALAAPGTFDYSTTFSPNPLTTSVPGDYITVTPSSGTGLEATTDITLDNLSETGTSGMKGTLSDPFTIGLTITSVDPAAGPLSKSETGTIEGKFNISSSSTSADFNTPLLTFDFGSAGIYTVDHFTFDRPSAQGTGTPPVPGAISATVHYAPAAAPEPSSLLGLGVGGFGILGLALRSRKARLSA